MGKKLAEVIVENGIEYYLAEGGMNICMGDEECYRGAIVVEKCGKVCGVW